jgi:hypothetical protein
MASYMYQRRATPTASSHPYNYQHLLLPLILTITNTYCCLYPYNYQHLLLPLILTITNQYIQRFLHFLFSSTCMNSYWIA